MQDKERRIREAARALFAEKGYDDTTVREIARRAGVATGTMFRYATTKRDLLFFVYNELRSAYPPLDIARIPAGAPLVAQLDAVFGHLMRFFADHPELARDVLREASLYADGRAFERYWAALADSEAALSDLLFRARAAGRLRPETPLDDLARLLFDLYRSELRRWVAEDGRDVARGLANMRPLLQLVLKGVAAAD